MRNALPLLTLPILLAPLSLALTFQCDHIREDGKKWDLSRLGGPHSFWVSEEVNPVMHNTTYTIDICKPLKTNSKIPKADQCESGTYICAVDRVRNVVDGTEPMIGDVKAIAGNYETSTGKGLEPKLTRLKASNPNSEGLRVELHGGIWNKRYQTAVIEFQCDHDLTGNEGFEDVNDKFRRIAANESTTISPDDKDEEDGDGEKEGDNKSLHFVGYGPVDEKTDVLRLDWKTKYACEDFEDDDDHEQPKKSGHWGFFAWFIIVGFLAIATYLIFGSWLNYSRYGARGWDLLPHGDTIRDIPYLFKDWSRKVVDTVQGGGSRGGYSAV